MALKIHGEGEAARLIGEIATQVEREGGWFNPDLEIRLDGSNISVLSSNLFEDLRSVIRVPLASMPLVDEFTMTMADGQLRATPMSDDVRGSHVRMMENMIGVYNVLGKVEQWRNESPWFSLLEYKDVLDHLQTGRFQKGRIGQMRKQIENGELNELLMDTFIGSRKFNLSGPYLKMLGYKADDRGRSVLLPIIDYFNHAMNAQGFSLHDTPPPASMRVKTRPHPETGELFVRYNVFDTLDTYLFYGFVEPGVGYLTSIPCEVRFGDLQLEVVSLGLAKSVKLPPAIKDLRLFMPGIQRKSEAVYQVNKLVIPGERAPRALRRVLRVFLNSIKFPQDELSETIKEIEESVLSQNEAWWKTLKEKSACLPENHTIHDLCNTALSHLEGYRSRMAGLE